MEVKGLEFEKTTPSDRRVRERIEALLAQRGRLTVAEFMAEALYGEGGYYRQERNPVGPQGDFYTSARVHPAFAALLAVQIEQVWVALGRPETLDVVEPGAGHGTLATDLAHALRDLSPRLAAAVRYQRVDWNRADHSRPQAGVSCDAPRTTAAEDEEPLFSGLPRLPGPIRGVLVANELLDALPVRRVIKHQGDLQELCVVLEGDRFVERPFPLDDPRLRAHVASWPEPWPEDAIAEVPLALFDWVGQLAVALDRGLAILLDYGDDRAALLARCSGTLRAYRRHRLVDDPFAEPGSVDLTCHVDLTSLREAARQHGLAVLGETTQAAFLRNLGWESIAKALEAAPLEPAAKEANLAALHDLISPAGLGGFKAIALAKGLDALEPVGWHGGGVPGSAPVLTRRHMSLW